MKILKLLNTNICLFWKFLDDNFFYLFFVNFMFIRYTPPTCPGERSHEEQHQDPHLHQDPQQQVISIQHVQDQDQ